MTPIRLRRGPWLALLACAALSGSVYGQTIHPAPPKEYDVQVRFRIRAPQPAWFDRFDELQAYLKGIGFVRDPRPDEEPEDVDGDVLTGSISSANARKILLHPFVRSILLSPRGYKLPDAADARVKVNLSLATGLAPDRQRVLSEQALEHLNKIGFRDAVGYDRRGHTRLFGTIAAPNLGKLLRDLRTEPSGWLVPMSPVSTLPTPLRNTVPVRVVEVLPEPNDVAPAQEPPPAPVYPEGELHLGKISTDLRNLIAQEKNGDKSLRLEVVLAEEPRFADRSWEVELRTAALGTVIEGRIGPIVTVTARAVRVPDLARPRMVLALRLPRSGETVFRPAGAKAADALSETRVGRLHQKGYRGAGVKVAVIAGDFGGYKPLLGNRLAKNTRLVDFTTARNPSLFPDPMPTDDGTGQGTLCAIAVRAAAPDAEIVLVRIDPSSPNQLLTVARLLNGETPNFETYADRLREIGRDGETLVIRRRELQSERQKAMDSLVFEEGNSMLPELKKKYEESQARLKKVLKDLEDLTKAEAELQSRTQRFLSLRSELTALSGVRVAVCPLVWGSGHPLDGGSELSRYFDERFSVPAAKVKKSPGGVLWVQAAGDTRGQTWSGLYRDDDLNGVLEFAPATQAVKKDRWTPELNFLAWQAFDGAAVPELPEKTRVRVSIQWREPHDRDLTNEPDDPFRDPIANLGIMVLKQRDPTGSKLASDDLDVVARSTSAPVRLRKENASGTYEQSVEFEIVSGGRFAVRVDGRIPDSNRPASSPALPTQRRGLEVRPRIFVEVLDAASQAKGRVVFADYTGTTTWPAASVTAPAQFGGVGMPADARNVLTVGSADATGKVSAASAVGAGPGREMMTKPDVLGFESIELGTSHRAGGTAIAAAFDAGVLACLVGMNVPPQPKAVNQLLNLAPGDVLRIPEEWVAPLKNR